MPLSRNKNFVNTSKKLLKNIYWNILVVRYLTWKLEFVLNILYMIASGNSFLLLTLLTGHFKLDLFDNFGNSKAFNGDLT